MKKFLVLGSVVYFLSRILFITPAPIFFDSGEYLARFQQANYFMAIDSGHIPLHAGYIILFWPIYHLAKLLHLPPISTLLFAQVVLSFAGLVIFFKIVKMLTNNLRIAIMSAVLMSLIPLFWIANVTLMIETAEVTFLLASTWAYLKFVQVPVEASWRKKTWWLVIGTSCFVFAFLTQPFVLLWLPFLWATFLFKKSQLKSLLILALALLVGFLLASGLNIWLIAQEIHSSFGVGFHYLFSSKLGEQASFSFSFETLAIYGRNFLLPLVRNNTPLILLLSICGFLKLARQKSWLCIWFLLLLAPAVIANQWWDSLFFGRHVLIISFGLCLLAAQILQNHKVWFVMSCVYLLVVAGYPMLLLRSPIPYLEEAAAIAQLPAGGLVIESHYARPQTQGKYRGQMIFVDEPTFNIATLGDQVKGVLASGQSVFVTGSALAEPYGFYTGPYLHTLGLSYRDEYHLKKTLEQFTVIPYELINPKDNLVIYQVTSAQPHVYPNIPALKNSSRRLDTAEPLTWLWLKLIQKRVS